MGCCLKSCGCRTAQNKLVDLQREKIALLTILASSLPGGRAALEELEALEWWT